MIKQISPFLYSAKIGISVLVFVSFLILHFQAEKKSQAPIVKGAKSSAIAIEQISTPVLKNYAKQPSFPARNIVALDANSGRVIVDQLAYVSVPIASMTKVMTAIIALEHYSLNDIVTIPKETVLSNGSVIGLKPGEQISIESLIYGLLINSGNDAANALAEHIGASEVFIRLMNAKAIELGLKNTQYFDPSGLSEKNTSSAYDVAMIFRYALLKPKFREIVNLPSFDITSIDGKITHHLENSNRLVKEQMYYEGIIGGKTGFTPIAGHNLVTAATRNSKTIIVTVINTHSSTTTASAEVARSVLDWVFSNIIWQTM